MEHAHDLYLKAIDNILLDKAKNIPQYEIGKGETYYNKDWDVKACFNLARNRFNYNSLFIKNKHKQVETVK